MPSIGSSSAIHGLRAPKAAVSSYPACRRTSIAAGVKSISVAVWPTFNSMAGNLPLSQSDVEHHLAGQGAEFSLQLIDGQGGRHKQVRSDLEGLLAGHPAADDLGVNVLDADATLRQYLRQAADDPQPILADQFKLDPAKRGGHVGAVALGDDHLQTAGLQSAQRS